MRLDDIRNKIPQALYNSLLPSVDELRPAQEKAIESGLLEGSNIVVCTPTASGKTLIAELAGVNRILERRGKMVYIAPLKALANEKYGDFKKRYGLYLKIALSIGDLDSSDSYLESYDMIICTAEKLDSLIRHGAHWLSGVATVVIDEVHVLDDPGRGPTLEIIMTMLKQMLKNVQIIALSATIGNPEELAAWLDARLVIDDWRPVKLYKGVYLEGRVKFKEEKF